MTSDKFIFAVFVFQNIIIQDFTENQPDLHTALQITLVKMMRSSSTISINFKLSTILNTVTSIIQDHIIDQSIYWKTIKQLTILNTVNPCMLCYINNVQGH